MIRTIFRMGLFCLVLAGGASFASGNKWEHVQNSTVYIFFDVIDQATGAKTVVQGTGFVVSRLGYVLTASHLLRDWNKQSKLEKEKYPIRASIGDKPGYVSGSPLNLAVIIPGNPDSEDVALLKLPDPDHNSAQGYSPAPICMTSPQEAAMGDTLLAFGFPQGQNIQPVPGVLGTKNADGGRWAAAAAFAEGMSGGPVYDRSGNLIGLIKGGLADTQAVRWITPIRHAENLLRIAGFSEGCPNSGSDQTTVVPKTIAPKPIAERLAVKKTKEEVKPTNPPFPLGQIVNSVIIQVSNPKNAARVPNVAVSITILESGELVAGGSTDKDGEFRFPPHDGRLRIEVKDSRNRELAVKLRLPNTDGEFIFPPHDGRLHIEVKDSSSRELSVNLHLPKIEQ